LHHYLYPFTTTITTSPFFFSRSVAPRDLHSFPTRRSSDLLAQPFHAIFRRQGGRHQMRDAHLGNFRRARHEIVGERGGERLPLRSEEHTSELQSRGHLVCRLLLEKKKNKKRKQ